MSDDIRMETEDPVEERCATRPLARLGPPLLIAGALVIAAALVAFVFTGFPQVTCGGDTVEAERASGWTGTYGRPFALAALAAVILVLTGAALSARTRGGRIIAVAAPLGLTMAMFLLLGLLVVFGLQERPRLMWSFGAILTALALGLAATHQRGRGDRAALPTASATLIVIVAATVAVAADSADDVFGC